MTDRSETTETRRKRLLFRSQHRGTKEMDILLGGFAAERMADFSESELDNLEVLLSEADDDLYGWALGRMPVPDASDTPLLRDFIESVRRRGGASSH